GADAGPRARCSLPPRGANRAGCRETKRYVLRHVDACETTLNPGFKWERLAAFGLPARGRTCAPGFRRVPEVVIKGQGECLRTPSVTAEDAHEVYPGALAAHALPSVTVHFAHGAAPPWSGLMHRAARRRGPGAKPVRGTVRGRAARRRPSAA